jgi:neutral trehalase
MTQDEALNCATMLEAHPQNILVKLATARDIAEAQTFLDKIKKNARKKLRILAKDLHPDKTPDVTKHELLKNLFKVIEDLESRTLNDFIALPQTPVYIQIFVQTSAAGDTWIPVSPTGYYR